MKKAIIVIGWTLLAILLLSLVEVIIIAHMEGAGAQPWKLVRGGRGGTIFPVAVVPIFLAAIVIRFFWLRRHFSRKARHSETTNPRSSRSDVTGLCHWGVAASIGRNSVSVLRQMKADNTKESDIRR